MSSDLRMSLWRRLMLGAAACLSLGVTACGGGGAAVALATGGGGVGTGGTGIVLGTVLGLGSVKVDGRSFSSASPTYYSASASASANGGESVTNSQAVEVGARVDLQLDGTQQPTSLLIQPELEGAPSAVDTTTQTFQVQGVRVLVNTDPARGPVTFYSALSGLSAVASATWVEVHGAYGQDAKGPYILASLVEQLPASDDVMRITGEIDSLSPQSISVAGHSIPLGASTSIALPPGVSLAQGELVHAWQSIGGNWVVRVQALGSFTGSVQLSGVVYALGTSTFRLSGIPVDTSSLGASAPTPHNGDYLVVSGQADGKGTLVAKSIQAAPSGVSIQGTITGYVSASSFQLRGVPIDASRASFTASSSASQLGNGAYVVIQGVIPSGQSNVIQASQVSVLSAPPEGETVDLQGSISAVTDASHFAMSWQPDSGSTQIVGVTIAANAQYINGTASGVVANAPVEVEGTYQSGALSAYTIKFLPGTPSSVSSSGSTNSTLDISGRVYGWSSGSASFVVNGIALSLAQGVSLPSGFDNGVLVEVSFTPVSSTTGKVQQVVIDN